MWPYILYIFPWMSVCLDRETDSTVASEMTADQREALWLWFVLPLFNSNMFNVPWVPCVMPVFLSFAFSFSKVTSWKQWEYLFVPSPHCVFPPHQWFAAALGCGAPTGVWRSWQSTTVLFNLEHDIKVPFEMGHCFTSLSATRFHARRDNDGNLYWPSKLLLFHFLVSLCGVSATRSIGRCAKVWFTIVPHWVSLERL